MVGRQHASDGDQRQKLLPDQALVANPNQEVLGTGEALDDIAARIRAQAPMSVAEYMALCLGHPEHGYYVTRDPLGRAGDFITAPEVSQMFGELIGIWCAAGWQMMDAPAEWNLIELGPGRGTLMADALRAIRQTQAAAMIDMAAAGTIDPLLYPPFEMEQAAEALQLINDRGVWGKAVVHV